MSAGEPGPADAVEPLPLDRPPPAAAAFPAAAEPAPTRPLPARVPFGPLPAAPRPWARCWDDAPRPVTRAGCGGCTPNWNLGRGVAVEAGGDASGTAPLADDAAVAAAADTVVLPWEEAVPDAP